MQTLTTIRNKAIGGQTTLMILVFDKGLQGAVHNSAIGRAHDLPSVMARDEYSCDYAFAHKPQQTKGTRTVTSRQINSKESSTGSSNVSDL